MQSRSAMAITFAFYGFQESSVAMLQKINHSTRAYIWNANGLPGFLKRESEEVFRVLDEAEEAGLLQEITK